MPHRHPACSSIKHRESFMKYSKLVYILLAVISIQLVLTKYFRSNETAELESVAAPKNGRSTVLGKALPSEKKPEKEVEVIMKDPALTQAWGLEMTQAQKAWRVSQGSRDIVVAVI